MSCTRILWILSACLVHMSCMTILLNVLYTYLVDFECMSCTHVLYDYIVYTYCEHVLSSTSTYLVSLSCLHVLLTTTISCEQILSTNYSTLYHILSVSLVDKNIVSCFLILYITNIYLVYMYCEQLTSIL